MRKVKKLKRSKKRVKEDKKIKKAPEKVAKPSYYKTKNYKPNEVKIKKILKQPTEKKKL